MRIESQSAVVFNKALITGLTPVHLFSAVGKSSLGNNRILCTALGQLWIT